MHNHELDKGLEGHLVAGRLKPQEKDFMDEMTRNAVAPKNILSTLKERDPENKTSAKQVYNARHRYKVKMRASMTEMQHLCKKLDDNKYYYKYRTVVENGVEHLQDIFFAHPRSITLFNSFHTVLMMDSTYKTSKYKMPLFEIVGFTSTEKTFNVAFAWLSNEKEDNFIWALQQLRCLLRRETNLPKLKVGCPIPNSNKSWKQYCAKQSLGWEDSFIAAQHRFEEMMSTENVVPIQIVGAGSRETPLVID
ncbi:unnamed protein product [Trifolium pratense]|uniref:Uncharacterized protein n=1 Tax=Trifolium pratense TaxID=57577 RepID=A0ACB0LJ56_TRIPR|nr:unnamed protein product [Trifolium pratense]